METVKTEVVVVVRQVSEYTFPGYPDAKCSAHGDNACWRCARNPGNCVAETGSCSMYSETGMHWDTCPNRIR